MNISTPNSPSKNGILKKTVLAASRTGLGIAVGVGLLLGGCQQPDPQLKQASFAMAKMATQKALSRSCFYMIYPNGKPSDFVEYLFSDLGVAGWPLAFDEQEVEQMKAVGMVPLPREVVVSPRERQKPQQKELVLVPDDASNKIEAKGYLPEQDSPNVQNQWNLATATPDEATQQFCRSNLELGIDGKGGKGE